MKELLYKLGQQFLIFKANMGDSNLSNIRFGILCYEGRFKMGNNEAILREDNLGCALIERQEVEVCLPITVKPYTKTGPIKTKCCGAAIVKAGSRNCAGVKDGECSFTVTQKLRVEIPVVFGAKAMVGDTYVCCLNPCTNLYDDSADDEFGEHDKCYEDEEYDEEVDE